jgi:tetratricopeptide (TPR) repeat protein
MDNWRINHLKEMHQEDSTDEFVIYAIGQEYLKLEDFNKAIEYFDLLKSINAKYVGLYYHLAAAYAGLDDIDNALQTYEDGIAIATNLPDLHALSELKNAKLNFEMEL